LIFPTWSNLPSMNAGVACADVQWCGKRMVANVRCIVAGSAVTLKRRNASDDQAPAATSSFMPATPAMGICRVLKICSPRAIERRAELRLRRGRDRRPPTLGLVAISTGRGLSEVSIKSTPET
jgi:hypothetical protein